MQLNYSLGLLWTALFIRILQETLSLHLKRKSLLLKFFPPVSAQLKEALESLCPSFILFHLNNFIWFDCLSESLSANHQSIFNEIEVLKKLLLLFRFLYILRWT